MHLSRRTLLRGVGTAIALPMLEIMQPSARAAEKQPPLRTAFLFVPNGKHMPLWKPEATGKDFVLPKTLEPLAKVKDKFNVLSNLALDGARAHGDGPGDHARSAAAFLTGAHPKKTGGADIHNGISIDQAIAEAVGSQTRFASLELGLEGSSQAGECDSGYSCAYVSNLAWRNSTSPIANEIDPSAVFDRLFSSLDSGTAAAAARQSHRKSVLDFALQDANRLHATLGAADRRKLDEYLYSVREIESRLVRSEKRDVGNQGIPNYSRPSGIPRELDDHARLMLDMLVLAFQTDSTRVASMMFGNGGSPRSYPQLGVPEAHHGLSHHGKSPAKQAKLAKIDYYHVQKLAYFLESLDSIQEGDSTLLDNSLILYGSGISDGDKHNHDDLPILLAGRGGGRVRSGQHIEYLRQTPLCNLYAWMLRQYDPTASKFGDSNDLLDRLA